MGRSPGTTSLGIEDDGSIVRVDHPPQIRLEMALWLRIIPHLEDLKRSRMGFLDDRPGLLDRVGGGDRFPLRQMR